MIREAEIADLPAFLELCERFRASLETYPDCPIDMQSIMHVFGRHVNDSRMLALVAQHGDQLTGALLAMTQPLFWTTKVEEACDTMFYTERPGDGPWLLRRFLRWAHRRPRVRVITMAHSSGVEIERAESFYESCGLAKIGGLHQMVVRQAAKERAA